MRDLLKELGFTEHETEIYLTLVELGESSASKIAEKARIHRRNVYDTLNRLVKKGFVSSVIKNNRKYYSAVNPERILKIFREKADLVQTLLPSLKEKYQESRVEQEVRLYEGREGIKTFFEDMYEEAKNSCDFKIIGATGRLPKMLPYYLPKVLKRTAKFKRKVHVLWNSGLKLQQRTFLDVLKPKHRILPKGFFLATQIFIYGNKSAIAIWSDKPIITIIKSKQATDGFKNYFKLLWKISKK